MQVIVVVCVCICVLSQYYIAVMGALVCALPENIIVETAQCVFLIISDPLVTSCLSVIIALKQNKF